jgi:HSP20 family protein
MAEQNRQSENSSGQLQRTNQQGTSLSTGFDSFFISPRDFFGANPFSLMRRMSEEMNRMLGDFGGSSSGGDRNLWAPPIEVSERNGQYLVHAELPGLKPEDVKVEVNDDSLVIHGERRFEQSEGEGSLRRTERHYGQFYRAVQLPQGVDPAQVKAKFDNGVLEVNIPAPEQRSNRRQIPVQGASTEGSSGDATSTSESQQTKSTNPSQSRQAA